MTMKKMITMMLLTAILVTNMAVPAKEAKAEGDKYGVGYRDENGELVVSVDGDGNIVFDKRVLGIRITAKEFTPEHRDDNETPKITKGVTAQMECDIYGFNNYSGADGLDVNGKPYAFTWSTSNPNIASITSNGLLTAKNTGKVAITAELASNKQKTTQVIEVVENKKVIVYDDEGIKRACKRKDIISYDKNGNLVWKMQIKNDSKKKYLYVFGKQEIQSNLYNKEINLVVSKDYKWKKGKNKKYKYSFRKSGIRTSKLVFTLKPGKIKTIKVLTVKKSKLPKNCYNLDLRRAIDDHLSRADMNYFKWSYVVKSRKEKIFSFL